MFNYLNKILYKSSKTELQDGDNSFQPFLIQRWCSMHSTSVAQIVNETSNRYWQVYNDNITWYRALDAIIPKCRYEKITYIKKSKKETDIKEKDYIQKAANSLEISTRELINYIRDNNLKITLPKNNE